MTDETPQAIVQAALVLCLGGAAAAGACLAVAVATAVRMVPPAASHAGPVPPRLMRPVWRVARIAGHHVAPLLRAGHRAALTTRLRRAELEGSATPEQWLGGTLVYGAVAALAFAGCAAVFGLPVHLAIATGTVIGVLLPEIALRDAIVRRELLVQRELPTYLDVITLAVESGCSLVAAVGVAIDKSHDGPLRRALQRFLAELRAGRSRAEALRSLDAWVALPAVTALVGALLQAERTGARLGDVLRAQAAQRTNERFARAEKLAMQAPVKMLGPLILCIFPCTFLILAFPIGMKLAEGL